MARRSSLAAAGIAILQIFLGAPRPVSAQACPDPKPEDFAKETLISGDILNQPIELAVAADGKVFVAERFGRIQLYEPNGKVTTAVTLDTYTNPGSYDVGGVLGVAVGPDFPARENWVYVYWAPKSLWNGIGNSKAGKLVYRLSRYRFLGGRLDPASEQVLLEIPSEWETHNAGSLRFGKGGDLYLSTGDNSCASCNEQYSPLDERPGNQHSDAQRSTANTFDLRGKVLRIHPEPAPVDGKHYTIPAGNLKEKYAGLWTAAERAKVRPEIFTMGHRNPYRIFPDPITGRLFIGEFGPAARQASERGPAGADELSIVDSAANLGYPYFIKDNQAYCHWDYAAGKCVPIQGQAGMTYLPDRPVNSSPNNSGTQLLPPAKPAVLWEHDGPSPDPIAGLKTCGFGSGPVYHYNPASASKVKFPPWFENRWIVFAISGNWQPKLATIAPGPVSLLKEMVAAPFTSSHIQFSGGLHDMEFGADGTLYVVDYGPGHYSNSGGDGLFRIVYKGCLPTATGIADRGTARPPGASSLVLAGDGVIPVPEGAKRAEVLDLKGKRIWEGAPNPSSRTLALPDFSGAGLVRVRWTR